MDFDAIKKWATENKKELIVGVVIGFVLSRLLG